MDKPKTNYFVSFDTLILQPLTKGNKIFTQVIERDETFTVSKKPIHIVTRSCSFYGSNLESAMNSSQLLLGKRHKVPILLANAYGVPFIFIPTMSPSSDQNIWISYHAIRNFFTNGIDTSITLDNGQNFNLNVSEPTLHRQYSLARIIEIDFMKKQRRLDKSMYLFPSQDHKEVQKVKEDTYMEDAESPPEQDLFEDKS